MNIAEKEAIRIYQNYLIGGETDNEKLILYNAIKGALEWGGYKEKEIDVKKIYISPLSLDDTMIAISEATGYRVEDIFKGSDRKYSEARKIFCYVSVGNHNPQGIAYFLGKDRTTVIYMIDCIIAAISVNDKIIIKMLDQLNDIFRNSPRIDFNNYK